ncbi:MAG: hypothetical protein IKT84_02155 [Bacteroidales bacterium]|nr:hypothetical protein [Bacteroidales bacterium]
MNNSEKEKDIDQLIKDFFDATISTEDMDYLYSYFLEVKSIPPKWKTEADIIRAFGILRYSFLHKKDIENKIAQWQYKEEKKKRILKYTYRVAASILILLSVGIGTYFVDLNNSTPHNQYAQTTDMPATPILHHHDNKPATITDNEIKNKPTAEQNTMPTTATPQPDIIATAPIEQEHIPVLLAENETQIEIEQNLAADTAYMIADAGEVYDVLEMYCSTRCLNNDVYVAYFNVTGENFM